MSEAITPSVSTNVKIKLKEKIQNLDSVQSTYGHEETNPDGWPSVNIKAGDLEGNFASNVENSRDYAFNVLILFPMAPKYKPKSQPDVDAEEYAEQVIATVIDEIINSMDTDFELDGSDGTVLYMEAANCNWGYATTEAGATRAAQITLRIYTEVTVQQ